MRRISIAQSAIASLLLFGITVHVSADEVVAYSVNNFAIEAPLVDTPGDAVKGRKIAIQRNKGNCLTCHKMPIPEEADHGNTSPDLKGVASRWTEAQLRLRVVDSKQFNPITMMPAFYKTEGLNRVRKKFVGKPILTAQEVEHVVAYLMTLK